MTRQRRSWPGSARWKSSISTFACDYAGQADRASYLITTPEGHILIDSGYESESPLMAESVEQLKYRFQDIKILLIIHAHRDHSGAHRA
jgi:metallo-beta-lactamase class B